MVNSDYPNVLFRISVNAESGENIQIRVKEIPCKRLQKVIKTAGGKNIKIAEINQPTSIVDKRLVMEHIYCLEEKDVQPSILMLVDRAQKKADELLAHAQSVRDAAYGEVSIRYE
jgi:hypothetical protein